MKIALYDFDGTLYKGDTSLDFCFYVYRKKILRSILFPYQVLLFFTYLVGWLSVEKFKEKFYVFLKGISPFELDALLEEFWGKHFPVKFNHELLQIIGKQKKDQIKIVCVSASPALFMEPLLKKSGIDLIIGTELVFENRTYRIKGKNCRGYEKVRRLMKEFDLDQVKIVQAYGDNKYDIPMLGLANESFLIVRGKVIPLDSN